MLAERERLEALHIAAINKNAQRLRTNEGVSRRIEEILSRAAELALEEACGAVCEFDEAVLSIRPQTAAGALAVLRFVAMMMTAMLRFVAMIVRDYIGLECEKSAAISACVDLIEQEARS